MLLLRQEKIASLLAELAGTSIASGTSRAEKPTAFAVSSTDPALLDAVTRLVALLDDPPAAEILAEGTEREILWRLITGPQGPTVRAIGLADSNLTHLARAIAHIRANYDQVLRTDDLAAIATMSVTSFHRHFKALTSMSPGQYQKQLRMHHARARLLADPNDIAAVGYAIGYSSPSQFSREYTRTFGLPPSRHAAALRDRIH